MDIDQLLDLDSLGEQLNSMLQGNGFSLKDLVLALMTGDLSEALQILKQGTIDAILNDISGYKVIFISILLLGIFSAVFTQFSNIFQTKQISDISYYMVYLMLVITLLQVFSFASDIAVLVLDNIVTFAKLLVPTFLFTVGLASGEITAVGFYQILLCIIFLVQTFLLSFLVPIIYCYVILSILNGLMEGDKLTQLLDLMKKGMEYLLKACITIVTGFSVLQSMISPVVDHVKTSILQKVLSSIPGVGNLADSTAQTVYGSAIIIKNSIGTAFILIMIVLCLQPLVKLFILTLVMKAASAVTGIISDKRITLCTNRVGDGTFLLCKVTLASIALFIITIAIVTVSTNRGF